MGDFITAKPSRTRRHDCAHHLPDTVPHSVTTNDLWRCDCGRRWSVADIAEPPEPGSLRLGMSIAEGVSIDGPDGSTYWRPYRARFIGFPWSWCR